MISKKIKVILAEALIISMIIPNISVKASVNDSPTQINQDIKENNDLNSNISLPNNGQAQEQDKIVENDKLDEKDENQVKEEQALEEYNNGANEENEGISESIRRYVQSEPQINLESVQPISNVNKLAKLKNTASTIKIYSDPNLTEKSNIPYVSPPNTDYMPVLEVNGNSTKVIISGCIGWISNSYVDEISVNEVSSVSYYYVNNNSELVHYIGTSSPGSVVLGKAPNFLKQGARYISYDGQYFYEYSQENLTQTLNLIIENYRTGNRNNAINKENTFYLYYQNLSYRSKSIYTAEELNNFINNNTASNSKLRGLGTYIKEAEAIYGINATLILATAMHESAGGTSAKAQTMNNLFGIGVFDSQTGSGTSYAHPKDSVIDFAKNYISSGYSNPFHGYRYNGAIPGNKYRGANVRYASDPYWGEKVASHAYRIDKYLSGSGPLRETNSSRIVVAKNNAQVIDANGKALYNLLVDSSLVISNINLVNLNGRQYYEISPELGNSDGTYNWNYKGYIPVDSVSGISVHTPPVEVKSGINRYATAVELSKSSFSSSETIVIANGYAIPDGLTATPMASYLKAPLLLVENNSIPSFTQAEIKRLGAKNAIIVGGTGVVGQGIESQLNNLGITKVTRLGGLNRYETSLQVAKYIDSNLYDVSEIVVANGYGEADALSIAPVSGRDNLPILLVETNNIPTNVNSWLKSEDLNNAYIIGGSGVVTDGVLNQVNSMTKQNILGNRLGGANRYETNAKIIERFYGNSTDKVYITEGLELADALTSGPVAALNKSPIVLAEAQLTYTQKIVLDRMTANTIVQVGGVAPKNAVNNLRELLSRTQ